MYRVLCIIFHVSCINALCIMCYVLRTMYAAQCKMFHVSCIMYKVFTCIYVYMYVDV